MDEKKLEIMEYVFSRYQMLYMVDLIHDEYHCIKHTKIDEDDVVEENGNYTNFIRRYSNQYIDKRYRQLTQQVGSIFYLRQKLEAQEMVSCDYLLTDGEGRRTVYTRYQMENGVPTKAFLFSYVLDEEWTKYLERNRQLQDEYRIIASLCGDFSLICLVDTVTEKIDVYRQSNLPTQLVEFIKSNPYTEVQKFFVENFVVEEDREEFSKDTEVKTISKLLEQTDKVTIFCKTLPELHNGDENTFSKFVFCASVTGDHRIVFATENITPGKLVT